MTIRVLLTGAFGNLGFHTLEHLLANNNQVIAFDLNTPANQKKAKTVESLIKIVWGDITDKNLLCSVLQDVDAVIHLAAIIPPQSESNVQLSGAVNVEATLQLLDLMTEHNITKRLIFASSIGVFGRAQSRIPPLRADSTVSPEDEYGRQKARCEEAIKSSALDWSILRICPSPSVSPFGYSLDKLALVFDCGADARVEFVHPDDVGLAFANAATCNEAIGKILYLGGGSQCRFKHQDFINQFMGSIGLKPFPRNLFNNTEPPEFFGDWVDTEQSQKLLRFQRHTLHDLCNEFRQNAGILPYLIKPFGRPATWVLTKYVTQQRRKESEQCQA